MTTMKIKDAIQLLQKQDHEAELCVHNDEFHTWAASNMLATSTDGDLMFVCEDVTYLQNDLWPVEATPDMIKKQQQHIEYCQEQTAKSEGKSYHDMYKQGLEEAHRRMARLKALPSKEKPADMFNEKSISRYGDFVYRGAEELGGRFVYQGITPQDEVEVIPVENGPAQHCYVKIAALEAFVDAVRAHRAKEAKTALGYTHPSHRDRYLDERDQDKEA